MRNWIAKMIAQLESRLAKLDRASPEAIATGGQITAYKAVMDFHNKHECDIIDELRTLDCVAWHPNPNGSDYCCRYCLRTTKTNMDDTIDHREDCLWLKIMELPEDLKWPYTVA